MATPNAMDIDSNATAAIAHHNPMMSKSPVEIPLAPELFFDAVSFNEYIASLPFTVKKDARETAPKNAFMDALTSAEPTLPENLMFTDKGAVTNESTKSLLLDLFAELEKIISNERLDELLKAAWKESPDSTLKLIWNARSIHAGKSDRYLWYRCVGWLREHHPRTLLANLEWVVRPVIEKNMAKKEGRGNEDEAVVVEMKDGMDVDENDVTRFDVKDGGSHGYYCDLVNILYLAVKDQLRYDISPSKELTVPKTPARKAKAKPKSRRGRPMEEKEEKEKEEKPAVEVSKEDKEKIRKQNIALHLENSRKAHKLAKEQRAQKEKGDHARLVKKLTEDPFYRALHLSVARIFVEQIRRDEKILASGKNLGSISLASKWAPSLGKMHDRLTFVTSTLAELMFTPEAIGQAGQSREVYLKHARQHYRQHLSALRKAIDIVETKIVMQRFQEIHYNRVPSLAMDRYKTIFAKNDLDRFEAYLSNVANGKANISGAVLYPSTLIMQARKAFVASSEGLTLKDKERITAADIKNHLKRKIQQLEAKVVDAQWDTLVKRIRDSGTLQNAIAVVDVSGSMGWPTFSDGTTPLDTALGLGLIIAQVAKPPFSNTFITFSENPQVVKLNPDLGLGATINAMNSSQWSMTTDFNAVFEKLLLPMAIAKKVPKEDMVQRLFVFSDMQFDEAQNDRGNKKNEWETNYQRIKRLYEEAGYDMPEMVFWNLAGGRGGGPAPKPVTKEDQGTALVSGYSQGMLKVFMENGGFEDPEAEEEEFVEVGTDGVEKKVVVKKIDPLAIVKKAIGHPSYRMLEVVD